MEAVTPEMLTLLLAFLTLLGAQLGSTFMLLARMNDQNKRIDNLNGEMNRRFENVDRRFDEVHSRFDTMNNEMNRGFENVDRRFDEMNSRFDTMNQRFDETTLLIGELRDRTGRLEGTLEGFLAGRGDRDAA